MGFIKNPNGGPTPKIPDGGTLYDDDATGLDTAVSKSVVSRPFSSGLVFRIQCDEDGTYNVRYIDANGSIRSYYPSEQSYSTATDGLLEVNLDSFVREAYVRFVPAGDCSLFIEAWSYGRGA